MEELEVIPLFICLASFTGVPVLLFARLPVTEKYSDILGDSLLEELEVTSLATIENLLFPCADVAKFGSGLGDFVESLDWFADPPLGENIDV
jgi:hypothetical protein